jgi:hypothetical protein
MVKTKKAEPPFVGNPAFTDFSGNPAIPLIISRDPWLSVTRLLGLWLFHELMLI